MTADAMPADFDHCKRVYEAMLIHASRVEIDGAQALVYEGMLTRLFRDLNYSVPYYSKLRRQLTKMGCIRQLRRGGSTTPSQWELITEPTEDKFNKLTEDAKGSSVNMDVRVTSLEQRMRDLVTTLQTKGVI